MTREDNNHQLISGVLIGPLFDALPPSRRSRAVLKRWVSLTHRQEKTNKKEKKVWIKNGSFSPENFSILRRSSRRTCARYQRYRTRQELAERWKKVRVSKISNIMFFRLFERFLIKIFYQIVFRSPKRKNCRPRGKFVARGSNLKILEKKNWRHFTSNASNNECRS